MEYTFTATAEEIRALQLMLHRACQHSGMDVAAPAAHWNQKLIAAVKPEFPPVKPNGKGLETDSSH